MVGAQLQLDEPSGRVFGSLKLTVRGKPVGKQILSRVARGRVFPYMKAHVRNYITAVSNAARLAVERDGWVLPPADIPIRVDVVAHMPMPQSWPKKKQHALLGRPALGKPDEDNIRKAVKDALQGPKTGPRTHEGIVYQDDDQVTDGETMKRWCEPGQERTEIRVYLLSSIPEGRQ